MYLAVKLDPELRLEKVDVMRRHGHDDLERVFEHVRAAHAHLELAGRVGRPGQVRAEVLVLALVVARVGHGLARDLRVVEARVFPLRRFRVC